ncbi:MAG: SAM-dependent chlorinase/fluorinase [Haloarculaceae archaeon]
MLTLSSDFGSTYPAAMKGVIRQLSDAELLDVAHDLPRQSVRAGAFWLDQVLPYFPPAVHLAVVDPGVGTDRSALVVRAGDHALVGPDNGVLLPVARSLGEDDVEVFEVAVQGRGRQTDTSASLTDGPPSPQDWPPDPASSTFHGRDVFAPTAARVHEAGIDAIEGMEAIAPTESYDDLQFPEPTIKDDGIIGTALAVDSFGNAITNVPGEVLADRFGDHLKVNGVWASAQRTYANVEAGHRVITVGSHGNVELAVNRGRGDETFGISAGGRVRLYW